MPLPILNLTSAPTPQTLLRYFHQTESKWTEHLAESMQLDFGTAWANPKLSRIFDANRILDVSLPPGMSPDDAVQQAEAHYAAIGSKCSQWVMNPSAPPEQTTPMIECLRARGYQPFSADIMYLERLPSAPISGTNEPLRIIPTRASFRHARDLFNEFAQTIGEPELVEAEMLHLDDPHYDALLAIRDGEAIAHAGVLATGEIGRIDQVYVAKRFREMHIGATMMSRALEICARSLFKHVLLTVLADNTVAIRLYERFGFRRIGQIISYFAPGSDTPRKA